MLAKHSSQNLATRTHLGGAVEYDPIVILSESSLAPIIWSGVGHVENGLALPSPELLAPLAWASFLSLLTVEEWLVPGSCTPELREAKRRRILLLPSESKNKSTIRAM